MNYTFCIINHILLGDPITCTGDLTMPAITTRYNEIDCKFNAVQKIENCKKNYKCVLSDGGAIAIKNCIPDENSTITTMLMSFQRPGVNNPLIPAEDVVHLVVRVYDPYQNRGEIQNHKNLRNGTQKDFNKV